MLIQLKEEYTMKKIFYFTCISILIICTFSTANATVLINEIDYDQPGTDTAEFVELFNSGLDDIYLDNYHLDFINGGLAVTPTYHSFDLTGYSLAAGSYLVICGDASMVMNCNFDTGKSSNMIQNGSSDGIALYSGSILIDAITYEGVIDGITEGLNGALPDDPSNTMSIGRLMGHQDTNDNASDFESGCITPGTANITGSGNCSVAAVPLPSIIWLFASGLIGMVINAKKIKMVQK